MSRSPDERRYPRKPRRYFAIIGVALAAAVAGGILYFFRFHWLLAALIGVNLATFILYGYDKLAARFGRSRVPESVLHGFAFAGGTPGALLGQKLFRHKTVKGSFRRVFWILTLVQLALIAWLVWYFYWRAK